MTTVEQDARHGQAVVWLAAQVEAGNEGYQGFYADLLAKYDRYGHLTPGQVDAVHKGMEREAQWAERRAAEADELRDVPPLTEGRRLVVGEIMSVKWRENDYGGGYKVLLKEANGSKLWGGLPQSCDPELNPALNDRGIETYEVLVGCVVRMTATVQPSDNDPHFGFYKRPYSAVLITGEDLDGEDWRDHA